MYRREVLAGGASLGVLGLAGCVDSPGQAAFREGFEEGLGAWESRAAIGPEVPLSEFAWEVSVSSEQAAAGTRSLGIWNQGDYDDGVTWVIHPVSVSPGQAYRVTVTAQFWSESESFNTIRHAVLRLGTEPPTTEEDFPQPGVNTSALGETPYGGLREPLWLADGWRPYAFEWTTPQIATDTLYLAVGTAVIWEADATHYVDAITVEFDER